VVVAVLSIGAGTAWALIPGSDGVIHACFKSATGALRVVDAPSSCGPSESPLDLGGPTRGYAQGDASNAALGSSSSSILKIALPPGKYLLNAKTNLFNLPGSDAVFVPCDLRLDGTTTELDATRVVLEENATGNEASETNVPLQASLTLAAPAVVDFECAALTRGSSSNVVARYRQLDAVSLDTLN
jgi:hypothetical protein